MAQTEPAIKCFALAHRKDACCRGDPPVTHNHAAIMQSGFRMKNSEQQLNGEMSFELNTGFFINADGSVTFDGDYCAELFARELSDRSYQEVSPLVLSAGQRNNAMPAQLGHRAP